MYMTWTRPENFDLWLFERREIIHRQISIVWYRIRVAVVFLCIICESMHSILLFLNLFLHRGPLVRLRLSKLSGDLKSDHSETFEIWTFRRLDFKRSGFCLSHSFCPNQPFKIRTFLTGFLMVFEKMVAICPDFKGFWISDPIQNWDHFLTNLFLTVQNPD